MLPLSPSRRPILGLAVICTFLCTAPSAFAYSVSLSNGDSGSIVRWMTSSVDYHLHPDCSADLNTTVCLNEVRASFQQWESPSCTAINFQEAGYSSNLALTASRSIPSTAWRPPGVGRQPDSRTPSLPPP